MPHQYHLRKLNASDKLKWTKLWHEYVTFYRSTVSEEVTEHTFQQLIANREDTVCYVACDENDVAIGFMHYVVHFSTWQMNPICYMYDLYVAPEHRGCGAAKQLVAKLKDLRNDLGWSKVYWLTEADNHIARRFYDKEAKGSAWIEYILD